MFFLLKPLIRDFTPSLGGIRRWTEPGNIFFSLFLLGEWVGNFPYGNMRSMCLWVYVYMHMCVCYIDTTNTFKIYSFSMCIFSVYINMYVYINTHTYSPYERERRVGAERKRKKIQGNFSIVLSFKVKSQITHKSPGTSANLR